MEKPITEKEGILFIEYILCRDDVTVWDTRIKDRLKYIERSSQLAKKKKFIDWEPLRGADCLKGKVSKNTEWTRDEFIIRDGTNKVKGNRKINRKRQRGAKRKE